MTTLSRLTLTAALLGVLAVPAMAQGGAPASAPAARAGAAVVTPAKPVTPVAGQAATGQNQAGQAAAARPGAAVTTPATPARTH